MNLLLTLIAACTVALCVACETPVGPVAPGFVDDPARQPITARRMPAEWEPQAAVWLQWPQAWEGDAVQRAFVNIVEVIARYETVQLLAHDEATRARGVVALAGVQGDVRWHLVPTDGSWMRDNGPRYVWRDGALVAQNWAFSAYGLAEHPSAYRNDDANPESVARLLALPVERVGLVHERGDLEVNGRDTAMVNWSVISHRNPGMDRPEAARRLRAALGVERVVFVEGFHPGDVTRGHIDGIARFIDVDTVVVADDGSALFDRMAGQIRTQAPDLTVRRLRIEPEDPVVNWLVGDGFVLTGSTGDANADATLSAEIGALFPGRAIHMVDIAALWANGGGVHCVTNDQPQGR